MSPPMIEHPWNMRHHSGRLRTPESKIIILRPVEFFPEAAHLINDTLSHHQKMADVIVEIGEYNRFSKGIFGWIGFKNYWLPFENQERVAGESKWSFWKLFSLLISKELT